MIAVIDYGLGNVASVLNALEALGHKAVLSRDPAVLEGADGLILPGVGAFGEGMKRLHQHGLATLIPQLTQQGKPLLGICLGFQMIMANSQELGSHQGLGLIDCAVVRLPTDARLPHFGWATIEDNAGSPQGRLLHDLNKRAFYFVHSYAVIENYNHLPHALATYGESTFLAAVEQENIFGTQFHPEKSGASGLSLLHKFVELCK